MTLEKNLIDPFILSGGSGTRLWPLSRSTYPKQFQPLVGELSLLQQSCARVSAPLFNSPSVLCNSDHRFLVAEQVQQLKLDDVRIILEPVPRNTAPAALIAALMAAARNARAFRAAAMRAAMRAAGAVLRGTGSRMMRTSSSFNC